MKFSILIIKTKKEITYKYKENFLKFYRFFI